MVVTCVTQHVRVRDCPDASGSSEQPQAPGGRVAVNPGAAAVEQDRAAGAGSYCLVDGAPDGGRQRDQDDLGALAAHAQHLVAVLFAEVGDVRGGGFEDPQAEYGHEREVAGIGGLPGGGEQGLELQMGESQGR
jgi:hypothetical protein